MPRQRWLVGNWKMYGDTAFIRHWADNFHYKATPCRVAICPPAPYLQAVRVALPAAVGVGAQNIANHADNGAYTGEVSAAMAADCGGMLTLIGHSERRYAVSAETDADCAIKIRHAIASDLFAILCVGEDLPTRQQGNTIAFVINQLEAAVEGLRDTRQWEKLLIAYEPIWAIGSGITPTADDILAMHGALRRCLIGQTPAFGGTIPVLYGGSVSPDNAKLFGKIPDVDGFLVGGASLKPDAFADIHALME